MMLKGILVRGQKENRGIVEKASSLKKYIFSQEHNTAVNINLKSSSGEALPGNHEHIRGH